MRCTSLLVTALIAMSGKATELEFVADPAPLGMTQAVLHGFGSLQACSRVQGVIVFVPGANGDGREVLRDLRWKRFSVQRNMLLVGVSFSSPLHDLKAGCGYYRPGGGSGKVLLDGLSSFGCEGKPLFLYGFSGGAHFVANFVRWRPDVVYGWCAYSAAWWDSASVNCESPPGIIACGADDFRISATRDFFQDGREQGARWLWVEIPGQGHSPSRELENLFRRYIGLISEKAFSHGIWANVVTGRFETDSFCRDYPCAVGWLPDEKLYIDWKRLSRIGEMKSEAGNDCY